MKNKDRSLTPKQLHVIRNAATEPPSTGEYNLQHGVGTYLCRACGKALFQSDSKFISSCGWPSFDIAVPKAVLSRPDPDGLRQEIICSHCQAHLGHVFEGERLTEKNKRYCVNSLSLDFIENTEILDTEEAILAAGCFWGVEYFFKQLPGVLKTEVGYTGGTFPNPDYKVVCDGITGHVEAVRILYSPEMLSYESLLKYFFEIHDPEQSNGQGPDHGSQYRSAIFYYDQMQKQVAEDLVTILENKGCKVATLVLPVNTFWKAESFHQDYYTKMQQKPYCHTYTKRF